MMMNQDIYRPIGHCEDVLLGLQMELPKDHKIHYNLGRVIQELEELAKMVNYGNEEMS
jgi:uncharacterized protein YgfB (UPF0149 family)